MGRERWLGGGFGGYFADEGKNRLLLETLDIVWLDVGRPLCGLPVQSRRGH